MTSPSPVGLHRVLEPVGVLPQAAWRIDPDPTIGCRRGPGQGRAAQPRRCELSPAGREARRRPGGPAPGGAGDHRLTRQDAEPGHRQRRHARRSRRRGRARLAARPEAGGAGRLARLPLAHPAADHRRAGPLGRPLRAGARATAPPSCSVAPSPRCCPRTSPTSSPSPSWTSPARQHSRPRWSVATSSAGRAPSVAVLGGAGKSGSLTLAAARRAGASATVGIVPTDAERELLDDSGLADHVAHRRRARPGRALRRP